MYSAQPHWWPIIKLITNFERQSIGHTSIRAKKLFIHILETKFLLSCYKFLQCVDIGLVSIFFSICITSHTIAHSSISALFIFSDDYDGMYQNNNIYISHSRGRALSQSIQSKTICDGM